MSPLARNAVAVAVAILIAAAGWSLFSVKAVSESRAATSALMEKSTAAQAAIDKNQAKAADAALQASKLAGEKPPSRPAVTGTRPRTPDFSALLAAHPEMQRQFEKSYSGDKALEYGPLYRKLHLTQDQIDRLDLLLAKDFENSLDVDATAQAQGLARSDPTIAQLRKTQADELQAEQQTLLGPDGYQALQVYDAEGPVRARIGDASSMAVMSGNALNGDQMQQLTDLLAQTSPAFQKNPTAKLDPRSVDWDAALAQAQSFLTPAQIAAVHAEAQFAPLNQMQKQFYAGRPKE